MWLQPVVSTTCAKLSLTKVVHPKLVQEVLVHADISTTLNAYSRVVTSMEGKTASAMEEVLGEEDQE